MGHVCHLPKTLHADYFIHAEVKLEKLMYTTSKTEKNVLVIKT